MSQPKGADLVEREARAKADAAHGPGGAGWNATYWRTKYEAAATALEAAQSDKRVLRENLRRYAEREERLRAERDRLLESLQSGAYWRERKLEQELERAKTVANDLIRILDNSGMKALARQKRKALASGSAEGVTPEGP